MTTLLNRVLDGCALRHQALASNIANINTPGYERRDVEFMDQLKSAINANGTAGLSDFSPTVKTEKTNGSLRLEDEFAALSENQLLYVASADILSRKYDGIRRAIKGN